MARQQRATKINVMTETSVNGAVNQIESQIRAADIPTILDID